MTDYEVIKRGEQFWQIRDQFVHAYLVADDSGSLLIDTGLGLGDLKKLCVELSGFEPTVVLTHNHGDHMGGITQFGHVYVSEPDFVEVYDRMLREGTGTVETILPGICRILPDTDLEIVPLPGHTQGSLGILDTHYRRFFIGDYLSYTPVYMCLPGADMKAFQESLQRIQSLKDMYDELYTGHETSPVPDELLLDMLELVKLYHQGAARTEKALYFDQYPCRKISYRSASILI